jgi:hypothetical protein
MAVRLVTVHYAASNGSPKLIKYLFGNALYRAGLLLRRQGPCVDLAVFHANCRSTPSRLSIR